MTNRLIMAAVGAVIYVIIPLVAGAQFFSHIPRLAVWGATSGLIIYEILYQTREWINLKTIALYFAGFLIISDWLFTPVLFIFEPEYFQWSWLIPSFDRMVDIFFPIYGYRWSYIFATGLITAVGYYRVTRDTPSSVSSSAGGGGISSYGSAEMDFSRSQTTRYLLGSVLLNA